MPNRGNGQTGYQFVVRRPRRIELRHEFRVEVPVQKLALGSSPDLLVGDAREQVDVLDDSRDHVVREFPRGVAVFAHLVGHHRPFLAIHVIMSTPDDRAADSESRCEHRFAHFDPLLVDGEVVVEGDIALRDVVAAPRFRWHGYRVSPDEVPPEVAVAQAPKGLEDFPPVFLSESVHAVPGTGAGVPHLCRWDVFAPVGYVLQAQVFRLLPQEGLPS